MKKLLGFLLTAALLLGMTGCNLFDKSNYEMTDYSAETEEESEAGAVGYISDYAALKRAITWLVSEHEEAAELQFQNYDGNISRDLSQACWEVKSSTPIGAFAVDYTSFDLSRIVSFYQAEVFITYKRSAEQMEALEKVSGLSAFLKRLDKALSEGESYLVLQMSAASLTPELVKDYVQRAYYADALASPVLPQTEVSLYPDSGVERIIEIRLDYGMEAEVLADMRQSLSDACAAVWEELPAAEAAADSDEPEGQNADRLYDCVCYLNKNVLSDAEAGSSAYDALVLGSADSEGAAMALQALCTMLGPECQVVSGRLDNEPHYWNIVSLGGCWYHLDLCDPERCFLVSDEDMWGRYWWDTDIYPACNENYYYFGVEESAASEELPAMPEGVSLTD